MEITAGSPVGRRGSAGADLVEVFLERTDHIGVLAEQDTITSVSPAFGMGAGIRVFKGHRDGFVSTNDLSDAGLLLALDQALAMLSLERNAAVLSLAFCPTSRDFTIDKHQWLSQSLIWPPALHCCSRAPANSNAMASTLMCAVAPTPETGRRCLSLQVMEPSATTSACKSSGLSVLAADGEHRASIGRRYGDGSPR